MTTPIGSIPLNGAAPYTPTKVEIKETDQSIAIDGVVIDKDFAARLISHSENLMKFLAEIRVLPNFNQELPLEKLDTLKTLTKEAHALLGLHPTFNLEKARELHQQFKKDHQTMVQEMEKSNPFKDLQLEGTENNEKKAFLELMNNTPLSSLMFDCGGLLKMQEKQMKMLELGIEEMDKVIRFQENPEAPLSEQIKFPLIEVTLSINRLLGSGLFKF